MTNKPRNAVCIVCTDRRRSVDFYRNAFGAELLDGDPSFSCPWLQLGSLTITLLENAAKPSSLDFSDQAMATLLIEVDDLDAAFIRAVDHGARVISPPDEGGITFMVADPDGIFIEVMESAPDE